MSDNTRRSLEEYEALADEVERGGFQAVPDTLTLSDGMLRSSYENKVSR